MPDCTTKVCVSQRKQEAEKAKLPARRRPQPGGAGLRLIDFLDLWELKRCATGRGQRTGGVTKSNLSLRPRGQWVGELLCNRLALANGRKARKHIWQVVSESWHALILNALCFIKELLSKVEHTVFCSSQQMSWETRFLLGNWDTLS